MALVKTEPGREALQKRDRSLNPRERQILVIADGSRSRGQMVELLGQPAGLQIDRLMQLGFLKSLETDTVSAHQHLVRLIGAVDTRRSLVATKVYCVDMLQLIRDPEAASVRQAIQASVSEPELMDKVFLCLRFMQEKTASSYAAKVAARLAEIMPPQYLASLAECCDAVAAEGASIVVTPVTPVTPVALVTQH